MTDSVLVSDINDDIIDVEQEYNKLINQYDTYKNDNTTNNDRNNVLLSDLIIDKIHSIERDTGILIDCIELCNYSLLQLQKQEQENQHYDDTTIKNLNTINQQLDEYSYYIYNCANILTLNDIQQCVTFNEWYEYDLNHKFNLYMSTTTYNTIVNNVYNLIEWLVQYCNIEQIQTIVIDYVIEQSQCKFDMISCIILHILNQQDPVLQFDVDYNTIYKAIYNIKQHDNNILNAITNVITKLKTTTSNNEQLQYIQQAIELAYILNRYNVIYDLSTLYDSFNNNNNSTTYIQQLIYNIPVSTSRQNKSLTQTQWLDMIDVLIDLNNRYLSNDTIILQSLMLQYIKSMLLVSQFDTFEHAIRMLIKNDNKTNDSSKKHNNNNIKTTTIDNDSWNWEDSASDDDKQQQHTEQCNLLTPEQIEQSVIDAAIELINSSTSISDTSLVLAEQCLTLLPLAHLLSNNDIIEYSSDTINQLSTNEKHFLQGLYILQAINIDIVPIQARKYNDNSIEFITQLLHEYSALYKQTDALIELNQLWSNTDDDEQNAKIKLLLAETAIQYNDYNYAKTLLMQLLDNERYVLAADVCVKLAQQIDNNNDKRDLLATSLWAIDTNQINDVLQQLNNCTVTDDTPTEPKKTYNSINDMLNDIYNINDDNVNKQANNNIFDISTELATLTLLSGQQNNYNDITITVAAEQQYNKYQSLLKQNKDIFDILNKDTFTVQPNLSQQNYNVIHNNNTNNKNATNTNSISNNKKQSDNVVNNSNIKQQQQQQQQSDNTYWHDMAEWTDDTVVKNNDIEHDNNKIIVNNNNSNNDSITDTLQYDTNKLQHDELYQYSIVGHLLDSNQTRLLSELMQQYNIDTFIVLAEKLRIDFVDQQYTDNIDSMNATISDLITKPVQCYKFIYHRLYITVNGDDLQRIKLILQWCDLCYTIHIEQTTNRKSINTLSVYKQHIQLIDRLSNANVQCNYKRLLTNTTYQDELNTITNNANRIMLLRIQPRIQELLSDQLLTEQLTVTQSPAFTTANRRLSSGLSK